MGADTHLQGAYISSWEETHSICSISYAITLSYNISRYHTISYDTIPCHTISYDIISYHTISYNIISYHIISYHIISYHIISYHTISHHSIQYIPCTPCTMIPHISCMFLALACNPPSPMVWSWVTCGTRSFCKNCVGRI